MTTINVKITDQVVELTNRPTIASGGVNEDRVVFDFSEDWNNFSKTAIFYQDPDRVYSAVLNNNECVVPSGVLQTEGVLLFGVYGVQGDTVKTSQVVAIDIYQGAFAPGTMPDPSPDIYEQMIALVEQIPFSKGSGEESAVQLNSDSGAPKATGKRAIAVNRKTQAKGEAAFAANYSTQAGDDGSEPKRYQAAFNNGSKAKGDSSFSTGINTVAGGTASFVGGTASAAYGSNDVAFGNQGRANQDTIDSPAPTSSSGTGSGGSGSGSGGAATAEKTLLSLIKLATFALGNVVYANGPGAVALGQHSVAVGDNAVALGFRTIAGLATKNGEAVSPTDDISITETDAIKYATCALASGYMTHASGPASAAFNAKTKAAHMNSSAFGLGTHTTGENQLVCGSYNDPKVAGLFCVGFGTEEKGKTLFSVPQRSSNPAVRIGDQYLSEQDVQRFHTVDNTLELLADRTIRTSGAVVDDLSVGVTVNPTKGNFLAYKSLVVVFTLSTGKTTHLYSPGISLLECFTFSTISGVIYGATAETNTQGGTLKITVPDYTAGTIRSIQIYGKNT